MRAAAVILAAAVLMAGCARSSEPEQLEAEVRQQLETAVETAEPEAAKPVVIEDKSPLEGKVIVVDAGHGISDYKNYEPIAPNSKETKRAFVSGTAGKNQTEEELNLAMALRLRDALEAEGAVVHMTRTQHRWDMSNVGRAQFGNALNADISIRLHADGSENPEVHGTSVLVPGDKYISDSEMLALSREAGEAVLAAFTEETGSKNNGISVRNDMTGFNWSEVPVILVEMGFMTNPDEDALMETEEYQNKMTAGIVKGLENYFDNN